MNITNTIIASTASVLIYIFFIKPKKDNKAAEQKENPIPGIDTMSRLKGTIVTRYCTLILNNSLYT